MTLSLDPTITQRILLNCVLKLLPFKPEMDAKGWSYSYKILPLCLQVSQYSAVMELRFQWVSLPKHAPT